MKFENPVIDVKKFDVKDILTTSGEEGTTPTQCPARGDDQDL